MALARSEPHLAAVQYAAAADADATILPRAVEVADEALQPSIALRLAERWVRLDATSTEAKRAGALAALALHDIDRSASLFRDLIRTTPGGVEAGFASIEKELRAASNAFGARQVADRLAALYPGSPGARRTQAFAALRGEDAAAAAASFEIALQATPAPGVGSAGGADDAADPGGRRELLQASRRARIFAGAAAAALAESRDAAEREPTVANRFDYAVLLVVARRDDLAREALGPLMAEPQAAADALRLAGLMEYQDGDLDTASVRFTQLASTGHYADDALYYLGLIAERHADFERALNCYARVQSGDNTVAALLRAAAILQAHGAGQASGELLAQLLADEPSHGPDILAARAQMLARAGDGKRALELLDAALSQYPDSVDLKFAHASALEELGRVDETLKELAAVERARPLDPAAWNALGFTLADHSRDLPRARRLVERALAAAPQSAAIQDSMGWVLYRQGHAAEAVPYLTKAFDSEPGADIGAHLGEVLWQVGRRADAEKVWTQASAVDSESTLLKSTRRRLHAVD